VFETRTVFACSCSCEFGFCKLYRSWCTHWRDIPAIWMFCSIFYDTRFPNPVLHKVRTFYDCLTSLYNRLEAMLAKTSTLVPLLESKYELRTKNLLQTPNVKTKTIGGNSFISRGAHLWNTLPDDIKNLTSTAIFKSEIKEWNGDKCNCKICK